ncbi:MAG: hypothetical protein F9K30_06755 [Dechloromonas sp.]|nr:MAG: hypothetical protein F9K30_06755 [Dechloromonas sp.]
MRHYVANSPQALARLLALGMLIDGMAEEVEYQLLEDSGVLRDLGITPQQLDEVLRDFYEDLDLGTSMTRTLDQRLTAGDLSQLVAEVTDSELQQPLLLAMMRIAVANGELSAGEARLIREALVHWTSDDGIGHPALLANVPRRRLADRAT